MSGIPKGRADHLDLGTWNALCYFCGFKFKANEMRKHWQGFYVCERCWEPRQPQDFVRAIPDKMAAPWAQPVPADSFIDACTANGTSAVPGQAMPGCAYPGYLSPAYNSEGY